MDAEIAEASDRLVSRTAVEIVRTKFHESPPNERCCLRIKGLTQNEIGCFLEHWKSNAPKIELDKVKVVVSGESTRVPKEFRAAPEHSITYYRNNNDSGLLYIETKMESDEQGLRNLFTLRDSNFLDRSFDSDDVRVPAKIVELAWEIVGGNARQPTLVSKRVVEVLDMIHPAFVSVSIRKFARFVLAVMYETSKVKDNLSPEMVDSLVGHNLVELDMFPDNYWRIEFGGSRTQRRLQLNGLHADLVKADNSDIDADQLIDQITNIEFRDVDRKIFQTSEQEKWRALCKEYCSTRLLACRRQIPYQIFEQLFTRDVKGIPLGERVENEIENYNASRLSEYESLNVKKGLDRHNPESAAKFLEAEPGEETGDLLPLRDLLLKQTRRRLEKLANPTAERFTDPLIKIAEVANIFREGYNVDEKDFVLKMSLSDSMTTSSPSVGLFAFLYGRSICNIMDDSSDTGGMEFKADEHLTSIVPPPKVRNDDEESDEEDDNEVTWEPVQVEFHLFLIGRDGEEEEVDSEINIEWLPLECDWTVALWLLTAASDAPAHNELLTVPQDTDLDEWLKSAVTRDIAINNSREPISSDIASDPLVNELLELRRDFKRDASKDGIQFEMLNDFFVSWENLFQKAKELFVPDGQVDNRIHVLLRADFISEGEEKAVMLPIHPFKLRWLSAYLRRTVELARRAVTGDLALNIKNQNMYLNWISSLSSHQQPPLASIAQREFGFSSAERGWSEEYTHIRPGGKKVVSDSVDRLLLKEIAGQISEYLHFHPYKKDGLSLMIVLSRSAKFPAELVEGIRSGEWGNVPVDINVVAPKELWQDVTRHIEMLPTDDRTNIGDKLFPPLQLRLHDLQLTSDFNEIVKNIQCDVAVIPQFLHDEIVVQINTDRPNDKGGTFDPVLDRPVSVYGGGDGSDITVSMRPPNADPAMEAWSTLVVRHNRGRPVSVQQPENTDFVELVIKFEDTVRLFEAVHESAHWVVTLDRYIRREQIERLETKPDILTVKERVGSNSLYTLIVSSNVGRRFIIDRLERKLVNIAEIDGGPIHDESVTRELAESIYDETRKIFPRLALQAMGISRVTEEILGLIIARHVAEQEYPMLIADGVIAWISLDEHQDWFSGANASRADLCRITMERCEGKLYVDVLVVEGKLRQVYDPHGVEQVMTTLSLLEGFLTCGDHEMVDAKLWREYLLSAIETTNPEARFVKGPSEHELRGGRRQLPADLRDLFREGDFKLRSLNGVYSICRYDQNGHFTIESIDERVQVAKSFRNGIIELIDSLSGTKTPKHSTIYTSESKKSDIAPTVGKLGDNEEKTAIDVQKAAPNLEKTGTTEAEVQTTNEPQVDDSRLTEKDLTDGYQEILDTFSEFKISVQKTRDNCDRFVEGPASILYRIRPGDGVSIKKIFERADDLKLKLNLEEEQSIRCSVNRGYVEIDVPKTEKSRYFVKADDMWSKWSQSKEELVTPIGMDRFGKIVVLNFSSPNSPHLLMGGTTGSGKSEALNTILYGLVKNYSEHELRLLLVDPKGTELQIFSDDPHLEGQIGWDEKDTLTLLDQAVREMQFRYKKFKEARKRSLPDYNAVADKPIPWWVIVLDEYADLTSEPEAKKEIEALLKRLAQKARASGIHVIIATQKPSAEVISTNLRSNLPAQLALRVKSATESRVIMDESGAETLNGKGDAFFKSEGKLRRVQCAITDSK